MGNLVILCEKQVFAKGLNKCQKMDMEKLNEYIFEDDIPRLEQLKEIPKQQLSTKVPTLFYPGCGTDVLFPLFYTREMFNTAEINFIFVDEYETVGMIKTILDEVGISFSEDKEQINFYYENMLVHLKFIHSKIEKLLSDLPEYDIYFERAFRIMRDSIPDYEQTIIARLSNGGMLISDTGFEKQQLDYIDVPKELSSYGEMVIGKKK